MGNGDPVRDFSDVRDVVRAYVLLAELGIPGETYNVCSGRGVRVGDLAARLAARAARALRIVTDDDLVRPVDVPVLVGDSTKLVATTGWRARVHLRRHPRRGAGRGARARADRLSSPRAPRGCRSAPAGRANPAAWQWREGRAADGGRRPAPTEARSSDVPRQPARVRRRPAPRRLPHRATREGNGDRTDRRRRSRRRDRCRAPSLRRHAGTPRCGSSPSTACDEQSTGFLRPVAQRAG